MRLVAELVTHHFDTFTKRAGTRRVAPHVHHFHQLDIYLAGAGCARVAGLEPFRDSRAEGVLIPPLCAHAYEVSPGLALATFKVVLAPPCWRLFGARARRFAVPEYLMALVTAAARKGEVADPLQGPLLMAVAEVALCELQSQSGADRAAAGDAGSGARRTDLWPVLEQLHGAPAQARSVAGLARQLGLSSDHFAKLFAALTGEAPRRYLLALRMRAAAEELLRDEGLAIKSLADRYDYSTVHAFSRAFKRVFGSGPATYRRQQTRF